MHAETGVMGRSWLWLSGTCKQNECDDDDNNVEHSARPLFQIVRRSNRERNAYTSALSPCRTFNFIHIPSMAIVFSCV